MVVVNEKSGRSELGGGLVRLAIRLRSSHAHVHGDKLKARCRVNILYAVCQRSTQISLSQRNL